MSFTSAELALDTDNPEQVSAFSKRYIEPAISRLVSKIDGVCLETATKDVYNVVGTAGTTANLAAIGSARARLNQGLAPKDAYRALQLDSVTMASIVSGAQGLFHDQSQIKKAFTEGFIGRNAMADWYENERTYTHAVGSDVTSSTAANAAVTDGGTNITGDNININAGDVFTVAGVYACHPETKQSLGYLQQYVATAASTGAITVSPATVLSGAKQNVCSAASAQLATTAFNSQVMTFGGSASTSYKHNLMYHRDAFAFVMADLPEMDGQMCKTKRLEDMSMRVWMAPDIRNDQLLARIDVLWGFKTLRPAWACRITN